MTPIQRIETVVPPEGTLTIGPLPPGATVEVLVHAPGSPDAPDLQVAPLRYDRPIDPVVADDWDALN